MVQVITMMQVITMVQVIKTNKGHASGREVSLRMRSNGPAKISWKAS